LSTIEAFDSLHTQYNEQMEEDLVSRQVGGVAERVWTKHDWGESQEYIRVSLLNSILIMLILDHLVMDEYEDNQG
jgi:hypothetical protein